MLQTGDGTDGGGAVLFREHVEVRAAAEARVVLTMPPLEPVELVVAPELQRALRGSISIRYEAAGELVAVQCFAGQDGTARIGLVFGEPFFAEASRVRLDLERIADGPPPRYALRSR